MPTNKDALSIDFKEAAKGFLGEGPPDKTETAAVASTAIRMASRLTGAPEDAADLLQAAQNAIKSN